VWKPRRRGSSQQTDFDIRLKEREPTGTRTRLRTRTSKLFGRGNLLRGRVWETDGAGCTCEATGGDIPPIWTRCLFLKDYNVRHNCYRFK
jgi:hypothetical protein